jgi:hypothetical protein
MRTALKDEAQFDLGNALRGTAYSSESGKKRDQPPRIGQDGFRHAVLFFAFVFLPFIICHAQSGWYWQNPLPTGNELMAISYLPNTNATACVAVGAAGTILRSTDGGSHWMTRLVDSARLLIDV